MWSKSRASTKPGSAAEWLRPATAGFARKGRDSVVLSEVAAKADVPLGTLYRYFPSATQLVLALYRKQLTELHAASPAKKSPGRTAEPPAGNAGGRHGTPTATCRPTRSSAS